MNANDKETPKNGAPNPGNKTSATPPMEEKEIFTRTVETHETTTRFSSETRETNAESSSSTNAQSSANADPPAPAQEAASTSSVVIRRYTDSDVFDA
ncbi:MAG: hypothetical protein NZ534_13185, partial [Bacteroidia bacterium]|nr:hypothetical protein [Bacteroidia bacterium]